MCDVCAHVVQPLHTGHLRLLKLAGRARFARKTLTEEALALEWESVEAVRQAVAAPIAAGMRVIYARQRDHVLERLRSWGPLLGVKADMDPLIASALLEAYVWDQVMDAELRPLLEAVLGGGYDTGALRVSHVAATSFSPTQAAQAVLQDVLSRVKGSNATTQRLLGRIIMDGIDAGLEMDVIDGAISEQFEEWSGHRAELIAQTASTPTFEAGQQQAFLDAGVQLHRWLSQRDGLVRAAHDDADGQEVEIGKPFAVGGEEMRFPGDTSLGASAKNVIGCRCTTLPIIPEGGTSRTAVSPAGKLIDVSGMNDREMQRVELAMRDYEIRSAYPALREEIGGAQAVMELADRFSVSEGTVKRALGW